jgi:5-methylcytosine-specific restriction endonuclease McrA
LFISYVESRRGGGGNSNSRSSSQNYYRHVGNVNRVFETAKMHKNLNPNKYREDPSGKIINRDHYGRKFIHEKDNWEIDHIKPQSKGGSDYITNLQALNTHDNRAYGNREEGKPKREI